MRRKVVIPTFTLLAALAIGTITSQAVNADEPGSSPLVERIAEKFGLEETDVQAVFDAVIDERHDQMKAMHEERLSAAVSDGVITEGQRQALLEKHAEILEKRKMEREEMKAWMEDQGIDSTKLRKYLGFHRGGFRHGQKFIQ